MMGNQILSTSTNVHVGKNRLQFQLPSLSNGIYFVKVSNSELKGILKFTKQ